jgi:NAD(P)-dependent dehydrogenase (short-subunit alcohol dehydrogenase family)
MQRLEGRVAIVTGAGGGLGRQHAMLLARRGTAVVVNDIGGKGTWQGRPASNADAVADEITRSGGRAIPDHHSVCSADGAEAIVDSALDAFGRVDVLINNAGVLRSAPFDETTDDLFDEVIDVNLRGAFRVSRAAWPAMRDQGFGRIVNTTSNSGLLGIAGSSAYGTAKAALFGLTRVLAIEGAEFGIKVNAVAPLAYTRMAATSRAAPQAWRDGVGDDWARQLDPALVSPVVAWLASPDCTVTGEVLSAGAGRVARFFLGLTPGHYSPQLTVEEVDDHFDQIVQPEGYRVFSTAAEESRSLHRLVSKKPVQGAL